MLVSAQAQQPGLSNSNYFSTQSILLNPSSTSDPGNNQEIQLGSVKLFARNNYLFLPKKDFTYAMLGNLSLANFNDEFTEEKRYNGNIETDMNLVSITKAYGKFGFGLSTRFRLMSNINNFPSHLAKFLFEGFAYEDQHGKPYEAGDFSVKSMSWGEVAANASYMLYNLEHDMIKVGATVKRLYGVHNLGFYFGEIDYTVYNDTIDFQLLTGRYAMATPDVDREMITGKGWGLDVGITYVHTDKTCTHYTPFSRAVGCKKLSYDYKIGVSLIDIGGIRFNKQARIRDLNNAKGFWDNYSESNLSSPGVIDNALLSKFGEANPTITKDTLFVTMLPTAAAVEIDKRFGKHFYLNATGLLGISLRKNMGAFRSSYFAITPRFEHPKFGGALPITMYGYKSPTVGFMFRTQGVYFGTNNLLPFLGLTNWWGADLYIGIRFQIGTTPICKFELAKNKNFWCPSCK